MKRKLRVCQVATVKTAVYETCDVSEASSSTLECTKSKDVVEQPSFVSTNDDTKQPTQFNKCLGMMAACMADQREHFTQQCNQRFQTKLELLEAMTKEACEQPCSKKLKEGKQLLQEQDQKIMKMMLSAFEAAQEIENKQREFLKEWNKIE